MTPHYFTLAEANALLPKVEPLMARLLDKRAKVARLGNQISHLLEDTHSDVGGPVASELTVDFVAIERLIEKIQSHGCVIRDINVGLLDFLTERNGRDVFLCWRYGETSIEFYHELHTGFQGRRPV